MLIGGIAFGQHQSFYWTKKAQAVVNNDFVTTWNTANTSSGSSASDQITLPLHFAGTYDCTVDWGDGNTSVIDDDADPDKTHTYASAGTYTVTITGTFIGFRFNANGDILKLLSVDNWGTAEVGNAGDYFEDCENLTSIASDGNPFLNTTDFGNAFRNCISLTEVPALTTGAIDDMGSAFRNCQALTSVGLFNTSSATSWVSTFLGCGALTSIPLFDTSAGTNFTSFCNGTGFTTIPDFDFSSAQDMDFAFAFSSVTDINGNPALTMGSVTEASNMFANTTINTADYSQFLIDLESANQNSSVTFDGGDATYNTSGATARSALINDHSWTITDGGAQ